MGQRHGARGVKRPPDVVPVPPGFDPASVVLTFRVPNELDGQRLDRFVHWRIPRLTRSRAEEIVRACAVHADGRRRDPSDRVFAGETVLLVRERFVEPDAPRYFGVLYEDEALVVAQILAFKRNIVRRQIKRRESSASGARRNFWPTCTVYAFKVFIFSFFIFVRFVFF